MYSQYQQYQQNYQQQSNVSTQQQQQHWNGTAWVAHSSAAVQSGTHSTYEQPPSTKLPLTTNKIPPNPVTAFTQYYHAWLAHEKQCKEALRIIPLGHTAARQEAQRRVDWAKYYADESSRAAHFFYQNPNATSTPFELPPAPPNHITPAPPTPTIAVTQQRQPVQQQQQQQTTVKSSSDEVTPGGLTRYVKKCLEQCTTMERKKLVQAEVEKVIAKAIQEGNLHSKNWDLEPLIRAPGVVAPRTAITMRVQQQNHVIASKQPQANYYRPSPTNRNQTNNNNKDNNSYSRSYDDKLPENNSYYGSPAESNVPKRRSDQSESSFGARRSSDQSDTYYYAPASSTSPQHAAAAAASYYQSNPSSFGDSSSPSSSQKRVVSPDEGYLAFSPKNKKQKKKQKGFEKSALALAKRASRFSGQGGIWDASNSATTADNYDKYMGKKLIGGSQKVLDAEDFEQMKVKGTCQTLEKEYLRLTAPPRAELVRPQPVLERHLANLQQEYYDDKNNKNKSRHDYLWFCSQLKAVRQDCTVQHIQNAFGVDVYETHARIALQEGDLNEYNQCQTQLKELYETNNDSSAQKNQEEFIAYRLLYYLFLTTNEKYDGGSSDMYKIMLSLTKMENTRSQNTAVVHALKVREALALGDYLQFFRLHEKSPNLGRYLTERIVPTMRMRGLRRMAKAYKPTLELDLCTRHLGFECVEKGKEYLISCGCVIDGSNIITKDSTIHEPDVEKKNSLI